MPISPLPSLDRTAPTFKADTDLFFGTQLPLFSVQVESARVEINDNTVLAGNAADAAVSAAASANNASAAALGAANFKGLWPSLSGPLNKPASVKHNGRFWLLLNNLANVAASEPGVTADWTSLDAGQVSARISGNTTAVPGVFYTLLTPGITLTYADGDWAQDDATAGRNISGGQCFIDWRSHTLCGGAPSPSPMPWPNLRRIEAVYDGVTFQ